MLTAVPQNLPWSTSPALYGFRYLVSPCASNFSPAMPEVTFRSFDWISDKKIDKASVLSGGLLQSMPSDGLGTGAKESPWEARPGCRSVLEGDQLYVNADKKLPKSPN